MNKNTIAKYLRRLPDAEAYVRGGIDHPRLHAHISFYQSDSGVLVAVSAEGLPHGDKRGEAEFIIEIFDGGCGMLSGNAGGKYELPPLYSGNGLIEAVFLTERFHVDRIIDRAVVIHKTLSDGKTMRIGCGLIRGV